jgi:hypothetical protein
MHGRRVDAGLTGIERRGCLVECDQFGSFTLVRLNRPLAAYNVTRAPGGGYAWNARRKAKRVTYLLAAMTLTFTGLATLVALSFVILSPTLPREGGRRPLACLTRSPRPAGEGDAGQTRPPACSAVGVGCTRRSAAATIAEVPIRPPAATALRNLALPETWEGRIGASATRGTLVCRRPENINSTQVVLGISW